MNSGEDECVLSKLCGYNSGGLNNTAIDARFKCDNRIVETDGPGMQSLVAWRS